MVKYIAGFFDADGSVMLKWWKQSSWYCFTLQIEFSQHVANRHVLDEIQQFFGFGIIRTKVIDGKYNAAILTFTGAEALRVAERIHKFSVVKGDYLRYLIDVYRNLRGQYTKEQKNVLEAARKIKRKQTNTRIYNYPSAQWFAGYLDGDGSLMCRARSDRVERYTCGLGFAAAMWDTEGVRLLEKVFGGACSQDKRGHYTYYKYLSVENIDTILRPLVKHCRIKNRQAQVLIEALRRGRITTDTYTTMKALNTRND